MSFVVNAVKSVANAVSNVVSGVVKAVGSVVKGVVSAVGSVVSGVLNFVMSPFLGLFGVPSMPDVSAQNSTIQGVTLQRQGSDQQIPVIYGFRKVGGVVVFAETGSDSNKYLWVAYVLGEGPIEGVRDVLINDIPVGATNIPNINNQQKVILTDDASGKLKNRTILELSRGVATNVGTAVKAGIFSGSPSWTTDMAYNGLAVMFARFEWVNSTDQATADANPFTGTIPTLQCTVLGRKIINLETLDISNPSAIPAYDLYSGSYSYNPANIILDYLRNPYYGKGLGNNDIDWDSFKKAAVKYNQTVTYTSSGITGPIQTLHAVVDTSQTLFNNVKLLLQQSRSYLPYSRTGQYMLKVDDAGNETDILSGSAPIVRTFTKDNIIGSITYTGIERTSKYNQVVVTYCDPDQSWSQQSVAVPDTSSQEYATYLAEDGYRANKGDLSMPWITNYAVAQDMARLALQKSRWQDTVSFTATSEALDLMVGDCIYLDANILKFGTDPNAGAVKWRIVSTKVNNDYSVSIGCVRNQDSIYPHVRVTDRDYKLAVYVPKGATRIYPAEPIGTPIGLNPPGGAPTDPTDPKNPVDPPSPKGPSGPLIDVITIYDAKFTYNGSLATATLTWTNPANSLASQVILTTTQSGTTGGNVITVNLSGTTTSATITNLSIVTDYVTTAQVVYLTGDRSTKLVTFKFNPGSATVPPITPGTNLAIDYFKSVNGATVTSGGYPLSIRQVTISLIQDTSIGINQYLNGVVVYYKPSTNAKWYTTTIPVSVTPGTAITFTLNVGPRVYPQVPGAAVPKDCDDYDFIFRFAYSDGKQSKWQWRAMGNAIEWGGLTYQYNLFLRDMAGPTNPTIYAKEDATTYVPQVAGPNDITETRNLIVTAKLAQSFNQTANSIRFFLNPPVVADRANWVGLRIYRHKAGISGTGDYIDSRPVSYNTSSGEWSALVDSLTYDDTWEFVLVPLVYFGTDVVEAFNAQYLSGYFHNRTGDADYPSDYNWMNLWIVKPTETTATAKARLGTAVPKAIRNDTYFDSVTASTVLTSGHPSTPRKLSFTVKTSIANGTNGHVAKVRIYYKPSSNVYWKYADYSTTSENTSITFDSTQTTPGMDLGIPQYPVFPYLSDNYDFQLRIVYSDGTLSKYCAQFASVNIEDDGITTSAVYSFNPFGNRLFQPQTVWKDIVLEENAPPGAVTKPTDLTMPLTTILDKGTGATSGQAMFFFTPPVQAMLPYFAGIRIYRRDLTSGASTTYTVNDNNQPVANPYGSEDVAYQDINWDTKYAYLLTPIVWYQGALTPCTNSWYWSGAIHNRTTETTGLNPYPNATNNLPANWLAKSAAQWVNTATALASLTGPIVTTNPVVTLKSVTAFYGPNASKNYFEVKYSKPDTTTSVTIYRRGGPGYYGGGLWSVANYYGVGRWEQINVNDGGVSNVTGTVTVNLRAATTRNEFNDFYDPTFTINTNNPAVGMPNYLYRGSSSAPTIFNTDSSTQLLFVVTYNNGTSNVQSTQAYMFNIGGLPYSPPNSSYSIPVSSNTNLVNIADLNNITTVPAATNGVSLMRKVTEARSVVANTAMIDPTTYSTTPWVYATTNYLGTTITPAIV